MQKIATKVFVYSSIIFGVLGVLIILTMPSGGDGSSDLNIVLLKLLFITGFIILPSFALSVASKYLNGKS
jgi:hypothetical protein